MKICSRCLMPDTRPDTHFTGTVCSACLTHDKLAPVDWEVRRGDLAMILDPFERHAGHNPEYDCIVPSSGGKDSHWQVLTLIEMGARPLVVTCTTCHLTDVGRRNIDNLARYADTIEFTPNRSVRARLNNLALTLLGDISWPEHVLIHTYPFRVAVEMGIPLVFYGENPLAAYGGPPGEDEVRQMTRRWTQEFGGFLGMRPRDFVGSEGLTAADMRAYEGPDDAALEAAGVRAYFLGAFLSWDSRRNAEAAKQHGMAWSLPSLANWWAFENLDNAQTGIHDEFMRAKYGYSRAQAQLSVDVRQGHLTRAQAEAHLRTLSHRRADEDYAGLLLGDVLERVWLTREEYETTLAEFTTFPREARPAAPLRERAGQVTLDGKDATRYDGPTIQDPREGRSLRSVDEVLTEAMTDPNAVWNDSWGPDFGPGSDRSSL